MRHPRGGTRQARSHPCADMSSDTSLTGARNGMARTNSIRSRCPTGDGPAPARGGRSRPGHLRLSAMVRGQPVHGLVRAQSRQCPRIVGHGTEAQQVLLSALGDRFPGRAAAGRDRRPCLTSNSEARRPVKFLGGQSGESRHQAVSGQDQEARITHPHQHHQAEAAGSSGPLELPRRGEQCRDISDRSRNDGARRR